ncbi:LmeA family phospholipid-binding protein [Candidatus Atelocyanobacterium thalassae]|uniref:DUF2993 domain-containing protein n=2 Tax=Candidatus Atelocyanobacterium thalassae TaxID=713887 RepID=A0A086CG15_9CHRO|nr:DUF2993 domain-containing protein [Candidatus Atelocyanobacterium thalassa]KFF41129.1 MAG: Protein of unknown function (DUF2993) [Candidatus Atelocyanobacterium thalassa isolate SIO64986]BDA40183.1 hypothetical protein CPARK_000102100 [cyanobacterium endosymbiont of Braarudosphaera bigelowii]
MEWFTIFLSSLITAVSPVGFIIDNVIQNELRSQIVNVEKLSVRVNSTPSYKVVNGKFDNISIASRKAEVIKNLKIDSFELETDPIDINIDQIQQGGKVKNFRSFFNKPLQGAFKITIKEEDFNQALESQNIKSKLQELINDLLPRQAPQFKIVALRINFIRKDYLGLEVELEEDSASKETKNELIITTEVGFEIEKGYLIKLTNLNATLNKRKLSKRFLNFLTIGINENLNLKTLEKQGIVARILNLQVDDNMLKVAIFFRFDPLL